MSKIAAVILICILVLGIGVFVFSGIKDSVLDGHEQLRQEIRSWDYLSN